jgi:hypothetical protein
MKCVQPAKTVTKDNAWGHPEQSIRARFIIEQDDVGRTNHDYLGHRRGTHKYSQADVGKRIETVRIPNDPAYFSWYFLD